MTRSFFIMAALLSCLVLKAGPYVDSLQVEARQDTLREAKITSDRAATVARTQTDFITLQRDTKTTYHETDIRRPDGRGNTGLS